MGIGLVCKGRVKRGEVGITLGDGEGAEWEAKGDMVDSVWGRSGRDRSRRNGNLNGRRHVGDVEGEERIHEFTNSRSESIP